MTPPEAFSHKMEFSRWQDHGACTEVYRLAKTRSEIESLDIIFFGKPGRPALSRLYSEYCDECPVRQLCLEFAIVHDPDFGVWGGMSKTQRRTFMSKDQAALMRVALEEDWLQYDFLSEEDQSLADFLRSRIVWEKQQAERAKEKEHLQESPTLVYRPRELRVLHIEAS